MSEIAPLFVEAISKVMEIIEKFTFLVNHAKLMVKACIYRENNLETQAKWKASLSQGLEMIWPLEEEQGQVKTLEPL